MPLWATDHQKGVSLCGQPPPPVPINARLPPSVPPMQVRVHLLRSSAKAFTQCIRLFRLPSLVTKHLFTRRLPRWLTRVITFIILVNHCSGRMSLLHGHPPLA